VSLLTTQRPGGDTAGTRDYLMNGTTKDLASENIQDKTLINQFNRISELSEDNKTVVSKLIDAFLFQQEMKQKLAQ
jgi:hypothetical protein